MRRALSRMNGLAFSSLDFAFSSTLPPEAVAPKGLSELDEVCRAQRSFRGAQVEQIEKRSFRRDCVDATDAAYKLSLFCARVRGRQNPRKRIVSLKKSAKSAHSKRLRSPQIVFATTATTAATLIRRLNPCVRATACREGRGRRKCH